MMTSPFCSLRVAKDKLDKAPCPKQYIKVKLNHGKTQFDLLFCVKYYP